MFSKGKYPWITDVWFYVILRLSIYLEPETTLERSALKHEYVPFQYRFTIIDSVKSDRGFIIIPPSPDHPPPTHSKPQWGSAGVAKRKQLLSGSAA